MSRPRPAPAPRTPPHRPPAPAGLAALLLAATLLGGCGSSPPVQLYQLRAEAPTEAPPAARAGGAWALGPVSLPDYLNRDAIVRPVGQAGLSAPGSQRWAEPLRDAVPRLLAADLARLRGADQVWQAPAPAGVVIERQLRVELQRLDARADGLAVVLQARWTLVDPSGRTAPQVAGTHLEAPAADASTDALAAAHRLALWQLAQDIARRASLR